MDPFNMGQLTKEMVAARLKELQDPCAVAVDVMGKALLAAFRDEKKLVGSRRVAVIDICYGAMTGLLLADQNLAHGAVEILKSAHAAAGGLHLDPTEMMKLALRGIARIRLVATKDQLNDIAKALDSEFMGVGSIFNEKVSEEATLPFQR